MPFPPSLRLVPGTDFPWPSTPAAVWLHPARTRAGGESVEHRPIVLIHGFRGDHHGLGLIAHALSRRDVWVPDLPGFGATAPPATGIDLAALTAHIRMLCEACAEATGMRPLLVGHSFGSVLAAHAYARSPRIAPGLGLLSPIVQPPLEGSARLLTRLTRLYYAAGAALPDRLGDKLLAHPLIVRAMSEVMATSSDRMTRRFIHDQHARHFSDYADRRSLADAYRVSVEHTVAEVVPALADAARPVLVVAGDDDLIAPLAAARGFIEDLRARRVPVDEHVLAGVGHLLHYERPDEVAGAIESFARSLDAT